MPPIPSFSAANVKRRQLLAGSAAAVLAPWLMPREGLAAPAATPVAMRKLASRLRIVIPANAGGGWDQTGRTLGAALLASGAVDAVDYENMGGKGGTIGLAHYVEQYRAQPDTLLIGGMVMVGAIALQKPAVTLAQVQPLARLTSDYVVVAVPSDSPLRNAKDLTSALRADPHSVTMAGGSAGGVDHMFAGLLIRAAKGAPDQLNYLPYPGGNDVVQALRAGKAQVGLSGYSEFSNAVSAGQLRVIGISSRRGIFGLPTFREQGVQVDMANWRAVFTGQDVPAARVEELARALNQATAQDRWQTALRDNRWDAAWQTGKDFRDFLEIEQSTASVMTYLLKLKS
ncbi:MAG: tripartite tricarboxylate transporter substrate binding protein [Proteobacteria bacterium]|nr:tripartite tricarboxylate transporter substrate binding protein [Pseudomonadota bacterium]